MSKLAFPDGQEPLRVVPLQMHIYCDASENTYACAVYLRVQNGQEVSVGLVGAKARVTPMKTQSVYKI